MKFIEKFSNENLKRLFFKARGTDVNTGLRIERSTPQKGQEKSLVAYPYEVMVTHYDDVIEEIWSFDGQIHRSHGPAIIEYDRNTGRIVSERYFKNGELHRNDGPALRGMHDEGQINEEYYLNGVKTTLNTVTTPMVER